jgi:hypothetical protein
MSKSERPSRRRWLSGKSVVPPLKNASEAEAQEDLCAQNQRPRLVERGFERLADRLRSLTNLAHGVPLSLVVVPDG